jgi:MoaA/NifB/PqqE/SkfB family radical SAM enzyme
MEIPKKIYTRFRRFVLDVIRRINGFYAIIGVVDRIAGKMEALENSINILKAEQRADRERDNFTIVMEKIIVFAVELTNKCFYHCKICPHDGMTRQQGVMPKEDLAWTLTNIQAYRPDYNLEFDINCFGEPLTDNELVAKIAMIKKYLPKTRIHMNTTLGVPIPGGGGEYFEEMIRAGLTRMTISCYGYNHETYSANHGIDNFDTVIKNIYTLSDVMKKTRSKYFTADWKGLFHTMDGVEIHKEYQSYIDSGHEDYYSFKKMMLDSGFPLLTGPLHNFSGAMNINYTKRPYKPCHLHNGDSTVFRVNWDMKIVPCCVCWDQAITLGDLKEKSLREIYYDAPWRDFLDAHRTMTIKDRYPTCWACLSDPRAMML